MDVITVGETMVSFLPEEQEFIRYAHRFSKRTAGAESNVAIGLAKLGRTSAWVSKLGKDEFGEFILRELRGEGVDVSHVIKTNQAPTGIMFKQFSPGSETSVFYYRSGSAASTLTVQDLPLDAIRQAKILHLTGITPALSPSCKKTTDFLVNFAKENGVLVSFDPNIRLKLWSREDAKACLFPLLQKSDIVMMGLSEAEILMATTDVQTILTTLRGFGVQHIAIKLGKHGALVADGNNSYNILPNDVTVVDPIGAGDAFDAGFLCGILEGKPTQMCGIMGGLMGEFSISSHGDVEGLPSRETFKALLNNTTTIYR